MVVSATVNQGTASTFAHIKHVRAGRGRSWHAALILVLRSDGGNLYQSDENVVLLLVFRYE